MTFRMIVPHEVANANLVSSTVPENDFDEWDISTTYADGDKVIVIGTTHAIFESVQGSNLGNDPTTDDGTWWINIGSTNRWKAFDRYIGDPSTQATSAEWELTFTPITDSVALFGLSASTVQIVVEAGSPSASVYDETFDLRDESGVIDAFTYCFSPIVLADKLIATDIPPYSDATVTITVTETGGTVSVGQIVVGLATQLGQALDNVSLGIEDFSRVDQDEFGRFEIVERDFTNLVTLSFAYPSNLASWLVARLAERRAKPTVYAIDTQYGDNRLAAYGFFSNLQPVARFGDTSEALIELESLT